MAANKKEIDQDPSYVSKPDLPPALPPRQFYESVPFLTRTNSGLDAISQLPRLPCDNSKDEAEKEPTPKNSLSVSSFKSDDFPDWPNPPEDCMQLEEEHQNETNSSGVMTDKDILEPPSLFRDTTCSFEKGSKVRVSGNSGYIRFAETYEATTERETNEFVHQTVAYPQAFPQDSQILDEQLMAEIKEMECLLDQLTTRSNNSPGSTLKLQVAIAAETSDSFYDSDFQSSFHDNSLSIAIGRDGEAKEDQDDTRAAKNFEKTFTTEQTEDQKMQESQMPDLSNILNSESEEVVCRQPNIYNKNESGSLESEKGRPQAERKKSATALHNVTTSIVDREPTVTGENASTRKYPVPPPKPKYKPKLAVTSGVIQLQEKDLGAHSAKTLKAQMTTPTSQEQSSILFQSSGRENINCEFGQNNHKATVDTNEATKKRGPPLPLKPKKMT